jgi:uncharacterized membrane protein YhaH (DUF805 family)
MSVTQSLDPPTLRESLFSFRGRISRYQYWVRFYLPSFGITLGLSVVDMINGIYYGDNQYVPWLSSIFELAAMWPHLALSVKCCHDRDRSGWFLLISFIPFILLIPALMISGRVAVLLALIACCVWIWLFVEVYCRRGTIGDNRFGPDPMRLRIAWLAPTENFGSRPSNPGAPHNVSLSIIPSPMTYIARHWRGEFSLPISYWVNYCLFNAVMWLISVSVPFLVDIAKNPVIFAVTVSVGWSLAIAIGLWQLVGVWRSAGKHKGRGGRGFWAGAAHTMVILGVIGLVTTLSMPPSGSRSMLFP